MLLEFNYIVIKCNTNNKNVKTVIFKTEKKINKESLINLYLVEYFDTDYLLSYKILSAKKIELTIKKKKKEWDKIIRIFYEIETVNNDILNNIPKNIFITYKNNDIPKKVKSNLSKLNPEHTIFFYDDNKCVSFLEKHYSKKFANFFKQIKWGPIKSDFWRLCVLYVYGGVYYDIDIEPYVPISDFIEDNITFCTCLSVNKKHIFQAFLASTQKNFLIRTCIMIMYLKNNRKLNYFEMSGTYDMYFVLKKFLQNKEIKANKVYDMQKQKIKILEEYAEDNTNLVTITNTAKVRFQNVDIFKSRYNDYNFTEHCFE